MNRFLFVPALLALGGCTLIDLWDPPVVRVLEVRSCNDVADCANISFSVPDGLVSDGCVVPTPRCDTSSNRCTVDIRVRDSDGDQRRDSTCATVHPELEPHEVDCIDNDATAFPNADIDKDGFIRAGCAPAGVEQDCDDAHFTVKPGAVEACDGLVSACNGVTAPARRFEEDNDNDGHSMTGLPETVCVDVLGVNSTLLSFPRDDCDENDPHVYTGAPDLCDGRGNDCATGIVPDPLEDADGDRFASIGNLACDASLEGGFPATDCDDHDAFSYPGAPEACDFKVNDCDKRTSGSASAIDRSAIEDPDGDTFFAANAACFNPIADVECAGSSNDPTMRYCPPRIEVQLLTSAPNGAIGAFDFNADGLAEIVFDRPSNAACTGAHGLDLLFSVGTGAANWNGTKQTFACSTAGAPTATVSSMTAVDVDSDSAIELVTFTTASGNTADTVQVHSVALDANVTAATISSGTRYQLDARAAAVGEIDGSVHAELVVYDSASNDLAFYDFDASGQLPLQSVLGAGVASPPTIIDGAAGMIDGIRLFDVDVDGDVDIVTFAANTHDVKIRFNDGSGGFAATPATVITVASSAGFVQDVQLGDIEGHADGDVDMAVALGTDSDVSHRTAGLVLARRASGYVELPIGVDPDGDVLPIGGAGAIVPRMLRVDDLDHDGSAEIVYSVFASNTVAYVDEARTSTEADTRFTQHAIVSDFAGAEGIAAGDFDRDGDLDVVAVASSDQTVSYYRSDFASNLTFTPHNVDRAFTTTQDVEIADMNGDGRNDVIALSGTTTVPLTVWRSRLDDGSAYDELPGDDFPANPTAMAVGNLVGNLALDVATVLPTLNRVLVNVGTGNGTFASATSSNPPLSIDTIAGPTEVAIADMNGDGLDDLIVSAGGAEGRAAIYEIAPDRTVTEHVVSSTVTVCSDLAVADVNGDGKRDVLLACAGGALIELVNPGTLASEWSATTIATGTTTDLGKVRAADVDRDGDVDAVVIPSFSASLVVVRLDATGAAQGSPFSVDMGIPTDQPSTLALADFDRDGDVDVAVGGGGAGGLIRTLQCIDGSRGRYVASTLSSDRRGVRGLAIGDIDKDGILDLAGAMRIDSDVVWWSTSGTPWWNH